MEWTENYLGEKPTKPNNSWTAQEGTQGFSSQWVFECQDDHHHFQKNHGRNSPFLGLWVFSLSKFPSPYFCKLVCSCQPWPSLRMGHAMGWMLFHPIPKAAAKSLWTASSQLTKSEPVLCWINSRGMSKHCEPQLCHWWGHLATPKQCPQEATNSRLVFVSNCWYVSREHAVHLNHFHTKFGREIIKYLFCAQNTAQVPYLLILHINSHRFCSSDNTFILKWWLWGICHDWDV